MIIVLFSVYIVNLVFQFNAVEVCQRDIVYSKFTMSRCVSNTDEVITNLFARRNFASTWLNICIIFLNKDSRTRDSNKYLT